MRGDFTRNTFDSTRAYSGVLMQQGRVQIDADWNEQLAIQRHQDRTTRRDEIGPTGTPEGADGEAPGFRISASADGTNLVVEPGRYYLDGVLVENVEPVMVFQPGPTETRPRQPHVADPPGVSATLEPGIYLVYLHVFERHLTFLEDGSIREVALGGPDHATRTLTCWQVALLPIEDAGGSPPEGGEGSSGGVPAAPCDLAIPAWDALVAPPTATLAARATPGEDSDDVCVVPPSAGYRGPENQLYRVEVFTSGDAGTATFVWSRENGAVAASWVSSEDNVITISRNTTDTVLGFENDDWIELTADHVELADPNVADPGRLLVQIAAITDDTIQLRTLDSGLGGPGSPTNAQVDRANFPSRPIVRRWDGADGAATIPADGSWVALEDGVEVRFGPGPFVSGQYWLIPARTATRDVEWPVDEGGNPVPRGPRGVEHLYARLAMVEVGEDGVITVLSDCRDTFTPLALQDLRSLRYLGGDGLLHRPFVPVGELRAGVFVGDEPQEGVAVRFEVLDTTDAFLAETDTATTGTLVLDVLTDADGVARAWATVTATRVSTLRVRASRVGEDDQARPPFLHYRSDLDIELVACGCCLGTASAGATLSRPIELRAVHRGHLGCPAVRVEFELVGGGRLSFSDGSTIVSARGGRNVDPDGRLSARWTLGGSGAQRVSARIVDEDGKPVGEPVCFEALIAERELAYLGGDGQLATRREVPKPFLTVVRENGVPVPGVSVQYEVTEGSATLSAQSSDRGTASTLTVVTDADGVAAAYATLAAARDLYVRARWLDESGTPREPAVRFLVQVASPSKPTTAASVSVEGIEILDEDGVLVGAAVGAGDILLWPDVGRALRVRTEGGVDAARVGSPPIELSLGIPAVSGTSTLPGLQWLRLDGDRGLGTDGRVSFRPDAAVGAWVEAMADPRRQFGRSTLAARLLLRGDFRWAGTATTRARRTGTNPNPADRVGDLLLELVVELPGDDPLLGFNGELIRQRFPTAPTVTALLKGVKLADIDLGATTDRRELPVEPRRDRASPRSEAVTLRYDLNARRYRLRANSESSELDLAWSTSRGAYAVRAGARAWVFEDLPRIAR